MPCSIMIMRPGQLEGRIRMIPRKLYAILSNYATDTGSMSPATGRPIGGTAGYCSLLALNAVSQVQERPQTSVTVELTAHDRYWWTPNCSTSTTTRGLRSVGPVGSAS